MYVAVGKAARETARDQDTGEGGRTNGAKNDFVKNCVGKTTRPVHYVSTARGQRSIVNLKTQRL